MTAADGKQYDTQHYNLDVIIKDRRMSARQVAGYSQKFRLLTPELQEHIIARTKHAR